jgi:hypothetical protein
MPTLQSWERTAKAGTARRAPTLSRTQKGWGTRKGKGEGNDRLRKDSPGLLSDLGKRCSPTLAGAVDNHRRLRAREDGERPSPPRDCKAEKFRRVPLSFEPDRCDSELGWEGRADAQQ